MLYVQKYYFLQLTARFAVSEAIVAMDYVD